MHLINVTFIADMKGKLQSTLLCVKLFGDLNTHNSMFDLCTVPCTSVYSTGQFLG